MPTYEYRCRAGHEFELFQRMSDPPAEKCPLCGVEASRRISGGAGFLFKGDGFYITDYRSEEYRKAAKSEGASSLGGDSGSDSPPAQGGKDTAGQGAAAGSSNGSDGARSKDYSRRRSKAATGSDRSDDA